MIKKFDQKIRSRNWIARFDRAFLQYRTILCSAMQYCAMSCKIMPYCTAVCVTVCRVEQHCAPVCNTGQCYATWCNRAKIDPKTVLEEALGHPKSSPNRFRDALGTPRGIQERSKSVPGAFRDVRGTSRKRPESAQRRPRTSKNASRRVWELVEASKIDAKACPEAKQSGFLFSDRSRSIVGMISYQLWSIFGFAAKSANP